MKRPPILDCEQINYKRFFFMNSSISMNPGVELEIFHPTLDFIEP